MKASDVRAKTLDELNDELGSLKKEQFNLRFQKATGQLENTARVRKVRRDIARIKTIMAERSRHVAGANQREAFDGGVRSGRNTASSTISLL